MLSPSIYMSPTKYPDMIFAPRDLSISLADHLIDRGHEVYFFTAPDVKTKAHLMPGDQDLLEKDYVQSMLHGRQSERLQWGYFYTLKQNYELDMTERCFKFARENNMDIIHSYHDRLAHFFDDMTGIPTVYTLHDPLPTDQTDINYWLLNKFKNQRYVSISNAFRKSDILHLNYIDTVYHGINIPKVLPTTQSYIAFMGRLIAEKGADTAIDVAKAVGISIKLASSQDEADISDDGYYKKVLAPRIDPSFVTFTDFMKGSGKFEYLAGARCLLFPIQWEEPFGMVMIEAMACGTPVIAYNRGSVSEIVQDGITGFVVEPEKGVAGLVEAIKKIDQIDRAACRKHVEEKFTVEKMVEGYEKVYEKILSQ